MQLTGNQLLDDDQQHAQETKIGLPSTYYPCMSSCIPAAVRTAALHLYDLLKKGIMLISGRLGMNSPVTTSLACGDDVPKDPFLYIGSQGDQQP